MVDEDVEDVEDVDVVDDVGYDVQVYVVVDGEDSVNCTLGNGLLQLFWMFIHL